jgi:hypothetical protein
VAESRAFEADVKVRNLSLRRLSALVAIPLVLIAFVVLCPAPVPLWLQ